MLKIKIAILQTIGKVMKKLGRGSAIVGYLDERLGFNILKDVDFSETEIIFVVGTNGKTSITNTINQMYMNNKQSVLCNVEGANLTSGIKTSIIMDLKKCKVVSDVLLFEVDEKTVAKISTVLSPNHIILTNFFRDQLDRYHEIEIIIEEIMNVIKKTKPQVYYNSQDPLLEQYLTEIQTVKVTYALEADSRSTTEPFGIVEVKYCPVCQYKLQYEYYHIGHIGKFKCPNCKFKPVVATYQIDDNSQKMRVLNNQTKCEELVLNIDTDNQPKYFSINIALIATFAIKKFPSSVISQTMNHLKTPKGRNETFELNGVQVYLNLAKNVAGMEQTIQHLLSSKKELNLIIAFNDNYADGRDVSWIWDTQFELLLPKLKTLHLCGQRRHDMKLRFLYEGFENITMYETIEDCLKNIFIEKNYEIISNYTPMAKINKIIAEKLNG